jgi:hypothetical protein
VPSCEEGKEPNVEERSCDPCEAGKYSATASNDACTRCASGKYSEVVGSVSADECVECEEGKVGGMEGNACVPITGIAATADHSWDFRGCVDGEAVVDAAAGSELQATLMNGAQCTAEGVSFDGEDDYVDLDDWEWGGALTIEAYVKYETFKTWSTVLGFGNGEDADNLQLAHPDTRSEIAWYVFRGSSSTYTETSSWDLSVWTHVVVTVSGSIMQTFKNGALVGENAFGHEPLVLTRTQHWLGRSPWEGEENLEGSIAYVRMWHGVGLEEEDVQALYSEREMG